MSRLARDVQMPFSDVGQPDAHVHYRTLPRRSYHAVFCPGLVVPFATPKVALTTDDARVAELDGDPLAFTATPAKLAQAVRGGAASPLIHAADVPPDAARKRELLARSASAVEFVSSWRSDAVLRESCSRPSSSLSRSESSRHASASAARAGSRARIAHVDVGRDARPPSATGSLTVVGVVDGVPSRAQVAAIKSRERQRQRLAHGAHRPTSANSLYRPASQQSASSFAREAPQSMVLLRLQQAERARFYSADPAQEHARLAPRRRLREQSGNETHVSPVTWAVSSLAVD